MGNKKNHILNLLFLLLVFSLTIWAVFKGEDLSLIFSYIRTADPVYLFLGILCVVTFILGEAIIICYLLRVLGYRVRATRCYLYSFIGFFFSCITPSATGGQPAQVYYMKKDHIPIPESTLVLMIVTITYKMVLVVLGILVLLLRPRRVMVYLEPVMFWIYLGLALNVFCVTFMMILVFHPKLAKWLMVKGLKLLERMHLLRKKGKRLKKLESSMDDYHAAGEFYWKHKPVVIRAFLITVVQRLLLFFVTYLTYRAFGLSGENMVTIVCLQGMISLAVDMLPLPGGMGISERLFLSIFTPVFGTTLLLPAMIVSRGISYYSQLTISAIMTVAAHFIIGNYHSKESKPGGKAT
ncbi:MAG: flippase-like domain-containing protein [Lachnospiraceae bacterium]|nr:flippase-like domain-containing protein [Lachnospiraceae bacterium]